MCLKGIDGMANSTDPDQTAPKEQFDQGLHCLSRLCRHAVWSGLFLAHIHFLSWTARYQETGNILITLCTYTSWSGLSLPTYGIRFLHLIPQYQDTKVHKYPNQNVDEQAKLSICCMICHKEPFPHGSWLAYFVKKLCLLLMDTFLTLQTKDGLLKHKTGLQIFLHKSKSVAFSVVCLFGGWGHGLNPQPPDHQSDAHPTEPPRPPPFSFNQNM